MPKLPGKFDDLPKTASGVFGDDFQISGYQFAAKQKTALDGAVATTTVDIVPSKEKEAVRTIGKLSWKFPKPFGIAGFSLDKVEFDKKGTYKIETSITKDMHKIDALSLTTASDQGKEKETKIGLTYTGIKDLQVKLDAKPLAFKPDDVNFECMYGVGAIIMGMKFAGPSLDKAVTGMSFTSGSFFGSLIAKKKFKDLTVHGLYTSSKDMKVACTSSYVVGQAPKDVKLGLALAFAGKHHGVLKLKAETTVGAIATPKLSASIKKELVKGMTVIAGGTYSLGTSGGSKTYGCKLSIE